MKKINFLVILLALTVLSACNVFEKLDKKSGSRDVKEFEITEKMNSGDYGGVVTIVKDIINNSPDLKIIENQSNIQSYLVANYKDPVVQDYINLKTLEAEARLGLSNVKLSDILTEITNNTTSFNQVGANTGQKELQIKDIIPPDVNTEQLSLAVKAYVMALPVDNTAYLALKNTFEQDYLSGALAITIGTINSALELTSTFENDNYTKLTWNDFQDKHSATWNENVSTFKSNIELSLDMLTIIATNTNVVSKEDIDKVQSDAKAILTTIKPFGNEIEFTAFIDAVGLN